MSNARRLHPKRIPRSQRHRRFPKGTRYLDAITPVRSPAARLHHPRTGAQGHAVAPNALVPFRRRDRFLQLLERSWIRLDQMRFQHSARSDSAISAKIEPSNAPTSKYSDRSFEKNGRMSFMNCSTILSQFGFCHPWLLRRALATPLASFSVRSSLEGQFQFGFTSWTSPAACPPELQTCARAAHEGAEGLAPRNSCANETNSAGILTGQARNLLRKNTGAALRQRPLRRSQTSGTLRGAWLGPA